MKTNIIILVALLVSCLSGANAQERVIVSESISKSFEREYPGASNVEWANAGETTSAQFTYQNNFWVAYYRGGEKFASGRKIGELDHLPLNVQQAILDIKAGQEKKFGPIQSSYAIEMIKEGVTMYYLPMENNSISLVLSVDNSGNATVAKKHLKPASPPQNAELLAKKN